MIKTLQKKFVITAMTAITVLILLLLGAINIANIIIVQRELEQTLSMLSSAEGDYNRIPTVIEPSRPEGAFNQKKDDHDAFMSSTFFVVRFDADGEAVYVNTDRIPSVSDEEATQLAEEVFASGEASGSTGQFRYAASASLGGGTTLVFLDTSSDMYSYARVLLLSVGVGVACWVLMLLFVMLLSKKAIRPVAENIEKQKQFVTNAGHEIKTPLAIILANTDAMELYNGENKWSRNIREQVIRLNGLMKNLLMLARMDEGNAKMTAEEFSLSELLQENLRAFEEPMELRGLSLKAEVDPGVTVRACREQMVQLLSILLDNAMKYSDDGGEVEVLLHKNEKRVKLAVRNACSKLPQEEPDKLFDRFYRADAARTQQAGGYGIGLSVAQSIAEANRGSITAEYERPDHIVFTVRFK